MRSINRPWLTLTLLLAIGLSACSAAARLTPSADIPDPTASVQAQGTQADLSATAIAARLTEEALLVERSLRVSADLRSYYSYTPPGLDPSAPAPLILVFHGWRDHASLFQPAGLRQLADEHGILIAIPQGSGEDGEGSWNAGGCCGYAVEAALDEAAFVRLMLTDIARTTTLDPLRIYAVGFSNGGMLVYRLACEMSDTLAAVVSIAGPLLYTTCQPSQPVSILHIHGLLDPIIPFTGGGDLLSGGFPAVQDVLDLWAELDGCTVPVQVEQLEGGLTHTRYAACRAGSAVELYTVPDMGHGWPMPDEFPAAQVMWDFFSAHPRLK